MPSDPESIEAAVRAQHQRQPFSGVVQVRHDGRLLFAEAFGLADRAGRLPNTISTRFGTASGTKTFTAVAVCQLVEAGVLSLDTRLADAVEVPLPRFDPGITIHHLLTHTSGAPDYFDEDELDAQADFAAAFGDLPLDQVRSPADVVPLFAGKPMKCPPGERFHYNNGAFVLLGLSIEQASGMSYADYIEEHVFARAGMDDAGFFEMDQLPPRTALGYLPDGRVNTRELTARGMPDGGAFVTAGDMSHFWAALTEGRLMGPETAALMMRPHVEIDSSDDDGRHYGYGLWLTLRDGDVRRYTCTGADPGVAFISALFPARQLELTVLGNTEGDAWPLFGSLERLIGA